MPCTNPNVFQIFLSTPSARRATPALFGTLSVGIPFLSTPSARRATRHFPKPRFVKPISIHALREEGDKLRSATLSSRSVFLSTPSARRATCSHRSRDGTKKFLSTPSARRATLTGNGREPKYEFLSTPSARRATLHRSLSRQYRPISIHALREEGDEIDIHLLGCTDVFLSTPSARRATCGAGATLLAFLFLSTPSARRATDAPRHYPSTTYQFLSTPSARRATLESVMLEQTDIDFYPRPPRGGRLHHLRHPVQQNQISIHALREEGDWQHQGWPLALEYFYPRPPRGGRRVTQRAQHRAYKFLSTPSARRATETILAKSSRMRDFYPRPPRGGRPPRAAGSARKRSNFYPRPPRGGRQT